MVVVSTSSTTRYLIVKIMLFQIFALLKWYLPWYTPLFIINILAIFTLIDRDRLNFTTTQYIGVNCIISTTNSLYISYDGVIVWIFAIIVIGLLTDKLGYIGDRNTFILLTFF